MGLGSIGPTELIIIFVIMLLLFGGKKLPELAKGLGKGIREFKKASKDVQDGIAFPIRPYLAGILKPVSIIFLITSGYGR